MEKGVTEEGGGSGLPFNSAGMNGPKESSIYEWWN